MTRSTSWPADFLIIFYCKQTSSIRLHFGIAMLTVHRRVVVIAAAIVASLLCTQNSASARGSQAARQVPRDVHEDARDMARRLMGTKRFLKSRDERRRVEMRLHL
jgi:hypothetical protein